MRCGIRGVPSRPSPWVRASLSTDLGCRRMLGTCGEVARDPPLLATVISYTDRLKPFDVKRRRGPPPASRLRRSGDLGRVVYQGRTSEGPCGHGAAIRLPGGAGREAGG